MTHSIEKLNGRLNKKYPYCYIDKKNSSFCSVRCSLHPDSEVPVSSYELHKAHLCKHCYYQKKSTYTLEALSYKGKKVDRVFAYCEKHGQQFSVMCSAFGNSLHCVKCKAENQSTVQKNRMRLSFDQVKVPEGCSLFSYRTQGSGEACILQCSCGDMYYCFLSNNKRKCPKCSRSKNKTAEQWQQILDTTYPDKPVKIEDTFKVRMPSGEYKTKLKYSCQCGCGETGTGFVKNMLSFGCQSEKIRCGITSSFRVDMPCTLYYFRTPDDRYKIGVTNSSVTKRYSSDANKFSECQVLLLQRFDSGQDALNIEQSILKDNAEYRVNHPYFPNSGGGTEFFDRDVLGIT